MYDTAHRNEGVGLVTPMDGTSVAPSPAGMRLLWLSRTRAAEFVGAPIALGREFLVWDSSLSHVHLLGYSSIT